MTILYLLLSLLVVIGLLRVASFFLADWRLMTRPPLPPMYAWRLAPGWRMAQPLDIETFEPVGPWRPMPRFTGLMQVRSGILYARDTEFAGPRATWRAVAAFAGDTGAKMTLPAGRRP